MSRPPARGKRTKDGSRREEEYGTEFGVRADVLTDELINALRGNADKLRAPMVEFAQRLVAVPSLPGQEGGVATLVADEMRRLGYSRVWIDQTGNVIGLISANSESADRSARSVMFNTHMDQVDVGDPSRWPFPPFDGHIKDGEIWVGAQAI